MPLTSDLYEVLQVSPNADPDVIAAAYHRLARKYHPDVSNASGANDRMKALNAAYEILSDPARRASYDAWRARQRQSRSEPAAQTSGTARAKSASSSAASAPPRPQPPPPRPEPHPDATPTREPQHQGKPTGRTFATAVTIALCALLTLLILFRTQYSASRQAAPLAAPKSAYTASPTSSVEPTRTEVSTSTPVPTSTIAPTNTRDQRRPCARRARQNPRGSPSSRASPILAARVLRFATCHWQTHMSSTSHAVRCLRAYPFSPTAPGSPFWVTTARGRRLKSGRARCYGDTNGAHGTKTGLTQATSQATIGHGAVHSSRLALPLDSLTEHPLSTAPCDGASVACPRLSHRTATRILRASEWCCHTGTPSGEHPQDRLPLGQPTAVWHAAGQRSPTWHPTAVRLSSLPRSTWPQSDSRIRVCIRSSRPLSGRHSGGQRPASVVHLVQTAMRPHIRDQAQHWPQRAWQT